MNVRASTTIFLPLTGTMRRRIEQTIEGLTALLDEIDGDCDLEPGNDDEPSLGWAQNAYAAQYGGVDDREVENEHDEDDDPAEADECDAA